VGGGMSERAALPAPLAEVVGEFEGVDRGLRAE
jgi:hypothetical protein